MTPGYKTKAFWLTLAATLLSALLSSGVADAGTVAKGAAMLVSLLSTVGYASVRAFAKGPNGKAAWRTTEFWLSVAAVAVAALTASGVFHEGGLAMQALAGTSAILGALGYVARFQLPPTAVLLVAAALLAAGTTSACAANVPSGAFGTLSVPAGCESWPSLPLSVELAADVEGYRDAYDDAFDAWQHALGAPAFRWAKPGEEPDVLVTDEAPEGRWEECSKKAAPRRCEADTRRWCRGGKVAAEIRHARPLDAIEAYYISQHELGHALGVNHNGNPRSVMHAAIDLQDGLMTEGEEWPVFWILDSDAARARAVQR